MPVRAMRSMFGLCAACRGVLPPSDAWGSSAQPSGMTMAYFMGSPRESVGHRIIRAGRRHVAQPVDLRQGSAEVPGWRRVRHDDQRHLTAFVLVEGFMLDDRRNADLMLGQHTGDV